MGLLQSIFAAAPLVVFHNRICRTADFIRNIDKIAFADNFAIAYLYAVCYYINGNCE